MFMELAKIMAASFKAVVQVLANCWSQLGPGYQHARSGRWQSSDLAKASFLD